MEPMSLPEPVEKSKWGPIIYLVGVVMLGLTVLSGVIGSLILSWGGKQADGAAIAIAAAAASALALMIAPKVGNQ